jgi:hypothetical protein
MRFRLILRRNHLEIGLLSGESFPWPFLEGANARQITRLMEGWNCSRSKLIARLSLVYFAGVNLPICEDKVHLSMVFGRLTIRAARKIDS